MACSKEDIKPPAEQRENVKQIKLEDLDISETGIKLNWSVLQSMDFQYYEIFRSESKDGEPYQSLKTISNKEKTDFIDVDVPYSPNISYKIVGKLAENAIESNIQVYVRSEILSIKGNVDQVIPQFNENRLFLVDLNGQISILDLGTNEITKTLEIASRIGYVDIKDYNGRLELFVPRNDGWIYIYDANSFELIDRIDTGRASSSITFNKDKLFVSTDAWTQRPLKVYDRSSGALIEETGDFDLTRLRQIPGTDIELLEITLNIGPVDLDFYQFNANGTLVQHLNDNYHGDFDLDANIFSFFPDNEHFITGQKGAVYTSDMIYQSRLPQGYLKFSSFCFNEQEQLIYAGCSNERSIQKYDLADFSIQGFIKTKTYPQFIFRNGQQIVIVGLSSNANSASFVFEKVNI